MPCTRDWWRKNSPPSISKICKRPLRSTWNQWISLKRAYHQTMLCLYWKNELMECERRYGSVALTHQWFIIFGWFYNPIDVTLCVTDGFNQDAYLQITGHVTSCVLGILCWVPVLSLIFIFCELICEQFGYCCSRPFRCNSPHHATSFDQSGNKLVF